MGSKTFGAVTFKAYSNDHEPRHVHGFASETEVVVDLLLNGDVKKAGRKDSLKGARKTSDIKKILNTAADHFDELVILWEQAHDNT